MTDISKVQEWVTKAVADIAAFGGNTRKVDSKAEFRALGSLLANPNGLNEDDKDYIEGFMMYRSQKTAKVDGKKPEQNTERSVERPVIGAWGGNTPEEAQKAKDMHNIHKAYFDENGNIVKGEVLAKDGSVTVTSTHRKLDNGMIETIQTEKDLYGGETEVKFIYHPGENHPITTSSIMKTPEGKVIYKMQLETDGSISGFRYFDQDGDEVATVTGREGRFTEVVTDKDGNVITTRTGTYNDAMNWGYDPVDVSSIGSNINEKEIDDLNVIEKKLSKIGSNMNEKEIEPHFGTNN